MSKLVWQGAAATLLFLLTLQSFAGECQLIRNIKGVTLVSGADDLRAFEWLAFEAGRVLETGRGQVKPAYRKCHLMDGRGRFLLPGLIDAHGHISGLGLELSQVQLRGLRSEQSAVSAVKAFSINNPDQPWVLGRGWNQVLWPKKTFPTRASLDKAGVDKPIALSRVDGHALWVNSAALKIAGISVNTPDPAGGKIVRDAQGEATGVLIDKAMALVEKKLPSPGAEALDRLYDKAFEHLLSLGVVGVHDAGINQSELDRYVAREQEGRLPLRVYAMLAGSSPNLDRWLKAGVIDNGEDFLSVRSVKLYSDGALGSRGAALLAPYSDDIGNTGLLLTQPQTLLALVTKIMDAGFQANVHAIGDKGNRVVLNSFEKAYKNTGGRALRNRIEHAQVVSLDDIPRFKALDIIASMQPTHATSDKNMAGDRLGVQRLRGAYAWQKFLEQGTIIASGSDFPVEHANPFYGLHAAVTRQDQDNRPVGGWLPKEKMTLVQALRSFTLDAAYAAHQDTRLGSLETGKRADFILVDRDIFDVDPEALWQTQVLETWVGGVRRYSHPDA